MENPPWDCDSFRPGGARELAPEVEEGWVRSVLDRRGFGWPQEVEALEGRVSQASDIVEGSVSCGGSERAAQLRAVQPVFTDDLRVQVVVMELPARKYLLCCSASPPHPWLPDLALAVSYSCLDLYFQARNRTLLNTAPTSSQPAGKAVLHRVPLSEEESSGVASPC